ncbi:glycosyltransferase family 4 protein [Hansschlegelia quercus]|uniref:Glycosyltransferase WbuB n=1 Tax=Hansschlegelia quercus TaxID=2528245 RepID=A0A4Q9G965_9HYPH|nr:glycosyltransferase family 4 protein [Hansschlegelia quercus]TBN47317.1 glycosyltransferase WbuB [Hansschlegelia quercus]
MKVIIVNRFFAPDQSATSRMATSLATGLAADGFEVEAIASAAMHDDATRQAARSEMVDGVRVTRIGTTRFGRGTLLGRALDYASFHLGAAWRLLRSSSAGDVCVVCTDPPLMSISAMLPLALKRAKLVNWLNDLFPEAAFQAGVMKPRGLAGHLSLALRDASVRAAAANVTPMDAMAQALRLRGAPADRIAVVHHWSEGDALTPMPSRESGLRREWGLEGKFVIGYCGNLGRAHDFGALLDAAAMLKSRADIAFLIVGGGYRLQSVKQEASRLGLSNMMFEPLQPESLLRECLAAPDVHFVSLLPAFETSVVPSKFYGVAAAGRPTLFVGAPDGEIARLIRDNDCGKAFGIAGGLPLAAEIELLAASPDVVARWGANARALFDARFSRGRGLAAWGDIVTACALAPRSVDRPVIAASPSPRTP